MNDKPLPPLPIPKFTETIRGVPCITVTEHEHLMRTYALQARAQAAQAEVTDADIVAVMRDGNNCNYNDEAEHIQFARAILALRRKEIDG